MGAFGSYENETYLRGLAEPAPELPTALSGMATPGLTPWLLVRA